MPTYRLDIAYDGTRFAGWAVQPGLRTIQGEIEAGLEQIWDARRADGRRAHRHRRPRLGTGGQLRAGRATGHGPPPRRSTRSRRPRSRSTRRRRPRPASTPAAMPARAPTATACCRSGSPARSRRGRALWWPYPLDREALDACAAAALGTHDFTAFTPTQTEHVRFERDIFRCEWREGPGIGPDPILELWIEADAFMRNMVRALVGTMLEVAAGRRDRCRLPGACSTARPREAGGDRPAARPLPGIRQLLTVRRPLHRIDSGASPAHQRRRDPGRRASVAAAGARRGRRRRAPRRRPRLQPQRDGPLDHHPLAAVGRGGRASTTAPAASPPTARRSTACASPISA